MAGSSSHPCASEQYIKSNLGAGLVTDYDLQMNLHHIYCMLQGFAALYFVSFITPSISLSIYKNASPFWSKSTTSSAHSNSVPPPVFTTSTLTPYREDPYTFTSILEHHTSIDTCKPSPIVNPLPTLQPSPPLPPDLPQPIPEQHDRVHAPGSQSTPFDVFSRHGSTSMIGGSICFFALGIILGTASTRFSKPLDKTRRSVGKFRRLEVGRHPQIFSSSRIGDDLVNNFETTTPSMTQADIFGLWAPNVTLNGGIIIPPFNVTSALAAIPAKTSSRTYLRSG